MTTPASGPAILTGSVGFVTGGGRGIGRAIALALAETGADIAIFDLEPAVATVETVKKIGRRGLALVGDVADRQAVSAAVTRTVKELGRLDIVVNNAGLSERVGLEDLDEATLARILDVTLKGTVLVSQ